MGSGVVAGCMVRVMLMLMVAHRIGNDLSRDGMGWAAMMGVETEALY